MSDFKGFEKSRLSPIEMGMKSVYGNELKPEHFDHLESVLFDGGDPSEKVDWEFIDLMHQILNMSKSSYFRHHVSKDDDNGKLDFEKLKNLLFNNGPHSEIKHTYDTPKGTNYLQTRARAEP